MRHRGRAMAPLRVRARELRAAGHGYQAIADAVGVVVSTAWRWTVDMHVVTADEYDGRYPASRGRAA